MVAIDDHHITILLTLQISQRFHELLEILASEETPSEEDTEDDKNSSNQ